MATVTGLYNDYWSLPRVKPNYQAQIESFDKIAAFKNQQYEKAYSYINQLKQTTLSMDFMKEKYRDKMNTYNAELNQLFKDKDLRSVDLSESKIANTYVGWFDKVANDKELISAFKYEGKIKSEYARIKAGAQNPKKSGYADANFVVWQNAQGGLNDYLENDVDETFFSQPTPTYTPFYDVWKDINTLMSMAQESKDGLSYEIESPDGSTITTISKKELREGKLQSLFGLMDAQAINQLKINEKAQFFNTLGSIPKEQQPQYFEKIKGNIINSENYIYQNNLKTQQGSIAGLKADIAILKTKNTPEAETKLKEYEATLAKYEREYNRYEVEGKPDVDNLTGLGKHEIAELYGNYNMQLQLMGFAAAFASSDEVRKSRPNEAFYLTKNYQLDVAEFEHKQAYDWARLKQAEQEASLTGGSSNISYGANGLPVLNTVVEGDNSVVDGTALNTIKGEITALDGLIKSLSPDGKEIDFSNVDAADIVPIFYDSITKDNTYVADILENSSIAKAIEKVIQSKGWRQKGISLDKLTPQQQEDLKTELVESKEVQRAVNNDMILFRAARNSLITHLHDALVAGANQWNASGSGEKIVSRTNTDGSIDWVSEKTGDFVPEFSNLVAGILGTTTKAFKYGSMPLVTANGMGEKYKAVDLQLVNMMRPHIKGGGEFPIDGISTAYETAKSIKVVPKPLAKAVNQQVTVGGTTVTWKNGSVTILNSEGDPVSYVEIPTKQDNQMYSLTRAFASNDTLEGFQDLAGHVYNIQKAPNGGFVVYIDGVKQPNVLEDYSALSHFYKQKLSD